MTRLFAIQDTTLPSIPWTMVARHEMQAIRNHRQSLDLLDRRGGLSPCEALAVIEDRDWQPMTPVAARAALAARVAAHRA